jgi:AAA ATPase domain
MAAPPAPPGTETDDDVADARREALRKAFTPTRPLRSARRLAGRRAQLARVLRALEEEEAHVVIYAERGRGKTSLANLVADALRGRGVMVARYACSAENDFDAIMRGLMRDLPRSLLAAPAQCGEDRLAGCEAALPAGRLQPRDALGLTGRLTGWNLVLMVDEFDRVADEATRTRLADTIKVLSDRAAPIQFIILGVSENLEELLGRHPSIQRNVVGVPLPLLTDVEIEALLDQGARDSGLRFAPPVREAIVALSRGVPYVAQLLSLHAGYAALDRDDRDVVGEDLEAAIALAVAEADPRVVRLYETLTDGGRDTAMVAFLRALAAGAQDIFGRFELDTAATGVAGSVRIGGRLAPAALWRRLVDSGAVRACGSGGPQLYTMSEATFGAYTLMRAAIGDDAAQAAARERIRAAQ